ncbi:hypothetical protein FJZ48_03160, partial [Candidatus Uhrbacteria bacterium]|nr:hypothetical protein [Candidatus Uhrbacteria bacterium]
MNTQPGGSEVPKVSNPNVGVQIDQQANQAFSEKQKLKEQAGAAQAEQAPAVSKEELVDLSGAARSAKEVLSEYDTSFVSVQQGKDAERAKTLRQEIPEADINDA